MRSRLALTILMVCMALANTPAYGSTGGEKVMADSLIYSNDFEAGQGLWQVSNGLWSIGADATLPASVTRAGKMAGAVLGGSLPSSGFDTYLISTGIQLPRVAGDQEIRVNFLYWHEFNDHAYSSVSIRIDSGSGRFSAWKRVSPYYESPLNLGYWREASIILTPYAGKRVNLGFQLYGFTDSWGGPSGKGWRIDDIKVWLTTSTRFGVPVAWDFDQDWAQDPLGDRWMDPLGLFSVGASTAVPPPSGPFLIGSHIGNTNIPSSAYTTRQISPRISVPVPAAGVDVLLRFRYFLEINDHAWAEVQAAVDSGNGRWGAWKLIPGASYTTSTNWIRVPPYIPAEYYGKDIRLAFTLLTFRNSWGGASGKGLYVDDVDLFSSTDLPLVPQLVSPPDSMSHAGSQPRLQWRLAAAAFTYQLQMSNNATFTPLLLDTTGIEPTSLQIKQVVLPDSHEAFWRVRAVNANGVSAWSAPFRFWKGDVVAVKTGGAGMPSDIVLHQNYPNPFNPSTMISFSLPSRMHVRLSVFNCIGQEIVRLTDAPHDAGSHQVPFDGSQFASGVYWYRLQAGLTIRTGTMALIR